jgi:chromosome segregation ATPase
MNTNNINENENENLEKMMNRYIRVCKSNDLKTVSNIINEFKLNNPTKIIAQNNCVSINTLEKTRAFYNQVGGYTMIKIADRLCQSTDSNIIGGSGNILSNIASQAATASNHIQKADTKKIQDRIDTLSKHAEHAEQTLNDVTEHVNKHVNKHVDNVKKLGTTFSSLYHTTRDAVHNIHKSANPTIASGSHNQEIQKLQKELSEVKQELEKTKKELNECKNK